jgi:hypothetical protein
LLWKQNSDFFRTSGIGSASGTREDKRISYKGDVNLRAGTNKIALLSVACGLPVRSLVAACIYIYIVLQLIR